MEDIQKPLMLLAIKLLDKQDGMPSDEFEILERVLKATGTYNAAELLKNVTITKGVAFLNEDWAEENYGRFE